MEDIVRDVGVRVHVSTEDVDLSFDKSQVSSAHIIISTLGRLAELLTSKSIPLQHLKLFIIDDFQDFANLMNPDKPILVRCNQYSIT